MGAASLKMEEQVCLKLWVKLGCSRQHTQIVPKWQLAGQLAGTDFVNTDVQCAAQRSFHFCREQIWVGSACSKMEGKVYVKLCVKLQCSLRYT